MTLQNEVLIIALHQVDQRLKLLETLIGDEKIDEILKEYSNTDIVWLFRRKYV